MTSAQPLPVSVVIPAFRAETTLERTLESVRRQLLQPAEVIVVDDASDDATAAVAERAGARVLRMPRNGGPSKARNAGVAAASFPWIAFVDADDVWYERKLYAQWRALAHWPDAGCCFTDYDAVYADGHVVNGETCADPGYLRARAAERRGDAVRFEEAGFLAGFVRSMFVRQSSLIVRRALFERLGGFDERLRLAEDYDLLVRLAAAAPVTAVERPLVRYLRRPGSLSADPLAEIGAVERLWALVAAEPQRYSPTARALAARQRSGIARRGTALALRFGRFREAASYGARALRAQPAPGTLALYVAARVLDNGAGAAAYRWLRGKPWRRRTQLVPPREKATDSIQPRTA